MFSVFQINIRDGREAMEEDETKVAGPKLRWKIFIAFLTKTRRRSTSSVDDSLWHSVIHIYQLYLECENNITGNKDKRFLRIILDVCCRRLFQPVRSNNYIPKP